MSSRRLSQYSSIGWPSKCSRVSQFGSPVTLWSAWSLLPQSPGSRASRACLAIGPAVTASRAIDSTIAWLTMVSLRSRRAHPFAQDSDLFVGHAHGAMAGAVFLD